MSKQRTISEAEYETIEQYLQEQLPADEQARLARLEETDPDWKRKVDEVRALLAGLHYTMLREEVAGLEAQRVAQARETPVVSLPPRRKLNWMIAAGLILALGLAGYWFSRPTPQTALYSRFYRPDPGLPTVMGQSSQYQLDKAMVDYKTGRYAEALTAWKTLEAGHPASDTLQYFIGCSLQAMGRLDECIPPLESVASAAQSSFQKDAAWYLALAYAKRGQHDKALAWLETADHPQKQQLQAALNASR